MKRLREQLDPARRDYRAARYPGNLADDVLGVPSGAPGHRRTWLAATVLLALAAMVLVGWAILPDANPPTTEWTTHTPVDPSTPTLLTDSTNTSTAPDPTVLQDDLTADDDALSWTSALALTGDETDTQGDVPSTIVPTDESNPTASVAFLPTTAHLANTGDASFTSFSFSMPTFPSSPSWDVDDSTETTSQSEEET